MLISGCGPASRSASSKTHRSAAGAARSADDATSRGETGAVAAIPLPATASYQGLEYTITQADLHAPQPERHSGRFVPGTVGPKGLLVRLKVRNTTKGWKIGLSSLGLVKHDEASVADLEPDQALNDNQVGSGTTIEAHAWFASADPDSLDGYAFDIHDSNGIPAAFASPGPARDGYPVPATVPAVVGTVATWNSGIPAGVTVTGARFQLDGLPASAERATKGDRFLVVTLRLTPVRSQVYFTYTNDVRVEADGSATPPTRCEDTKGQNTTAIVPAGTTDDVTCAFAVPAAAAKVTLAVGATNPSPGKPMVKTVPVTHPPFPAIAAEGSPTSS
jgi:hypothetical protein